MLTVLHVIVGTVALFAVPVALFARKGGAWHRRAGTVFTVSMAFVLGTAAFLWEAKGHLFLVPLGFVTAYLLFHAWRVIARRRRGVDEIDDRVDRLAAFAVIVAGAATAAIGLTASTPLLLSIRPALLGIGAIGACFGINDLLGFTAPRSPAGWKLAHLSAMIAAYISATTAFLVINAHQVPMMLRWLVPSAVGATLIAAYSLSVLRPAARAKRQTVKIGRSPVAVTTAGDVDHSLPSS